MRNFCPHCGVGWEPGVHCRSCGRAWWSNPAPSACGILVASDKLLLVRRARSPFVGLWDLPGGFIESGERPEEALHREFLEETGLSVTAGKFIGAWSEEYSDSSRVIEQGTTLNLFFIVHPRESGTSLVSSDEGEPAWWPLLDLPEIAFPNSNVKALSAYSALCGIARRGNDGSSTHG